MKGALSTREIAVESQLATLTALGHTIADASFIKMIDNNSIKNCPVTRLDIKMVEDIYGVNPNMVKGKMVWKQPEHVREDRPQHH